MATQLPAACRHQPSPLPVQGLTCARATAVEADSKRLRPTPNCERGYVVATSSSSVVRRAKTVGSVREVALDEPGRREVSGVSKADLAGQGEHLDPGDPRSAGVGRRI